MKVAIAGSRKINEVDIAPHLPAETYGIISGGAVGVDTAARVFAAANGISLTEIKPDYPRYGRAAPIIRNKEIVDLADYVIVFWDGSSRGTQSVIKYAEKSNKPRKIIICGQ